MQILQQFSVTLSSVSIAIFVCNYLIFNTLKLQQISLTTKFIDTYNSSNSRYLRTDYVKRGNKSIIEKNKKKRMCLF